MMTTTDTYLPHKFPKLDKHDSYESILSWCCQACGEWIRTYGNYEKTSCTIDWRSLGMGSREKVMKEPPMGSVVIDKSGSAWQRHPVGWAIAGSDMSWAYTWDQVLKELYLPMDSPTAKWKPVLGDKRLPLIVYVPHEELLTGEEEDE